MLLQALLCLPPLTNLLVISNAGLLRGEAVLQPHPGVPQCSWVNVKVALIIYELELEVDISPISLCSRAASLQSLVSIYTIL